MTGILIADFLEGLSWTLNLDRTDWLVDPGGACLMEGKKNHLPSMVNATLYLVVQCVIAYVLQALHVRNMYHYL